MWLAGWKYRRKITINNSLAYGLSDYQVWIPTSAFGAQWSAIRSSAQPTMDDFRFTPSTATTTMPYWIDDNTTTPKGFWVRVSTLPVGSNTIYMYYGNLSISLASNGTNTFLLFDDFDDGDDTGWTRGRGTWNVGYYGGRTCYRQSNDADGTLSESIAGNPSTDIIIDILIQSPDTPGDGDTSHPGIVYRAADTNNYNVVYFRPHQGASGYQIAYMSGGALTGQSTGNLAVPWNAWYSITLKVFGSTVQIYKDSVFAASGTAYYTSSGKYGCWQADGMGYYDNIRVRKYAPTEPTISSVGSEESAFFSTGTYKSPVTDTASKIVVSSISWNPSSQPAGTNLAVSVRVSSYPFSIDSSTPSWITVTNGQSLNWHGRYIQYQSTFTTTNSTTTPRLEDISITYRVKPWQEKSVTRTPPNSFGFGGSESWTWQVPVKGGTLVTITAYIRYNTDYLGGTYDKPKLTLSGIGINESISATSSAENSWELRQLSGTPSSDGILTLKAEGFSPNSGGKFYVDDILINQ